MIRTFERLHPMQQLAVLRLTATPARAKALQDLPYDEFLTTPYWRAIRRIKLHDQPTCRTCGTTRRLQVHHDTYEHHGTEHANLGDLHVLCIDCHSHLHGIPRESTWVHVSAFIPAALAGLLEEVPA